MKAFKLLTRILGLNLKYTKFKFVKFLVSPFSNFCVALGPCAKSRPTNRKSARAEFLSHTYYLLLMKVIINENAAVKKTVFVLDSSFQDWIPDVFQ